MVYKMEQYFVEFEFIFFGIWFFFLVLMFLQLVEWVIGFFVFMIVFEIVFGIMLFIGFFWKLIVWVFFLFVVFFIVLMGFIFLIGYVFVGVNFFQFGQWGLYVEINMKVIDCGCFGDFIKLVFFIFFMKDVFLFVFFVLFLVFYGKMYQFMGVGGCIVMVILGIVVLMFYCFSNYMWDILYIDFCFFYNEVNICLEKELEDFVENNVEVIVYKVINKEIGEIVQFFIDEYLKKYKDYLKEEWDFEQIKVKFVVKVVKIVDGYGILSVEGEFYEVELVSYLVQQWELEGDIIVKVVECSKISDFELLGGLEGGDVIYDIFNNLDYSFMVVVYKLYIEKEEVIIQMFCDIIYKVDIVAVEDIIKLVCSIDWVDKWQIE